MNKKNVLRNFVETYLIVNKIKYEIDKNDIYTVYFETKHANKLGKKREFCFNRELSDDYGVDFISLNNDIVKYFLRDSVAKGQILKAKFDSSFILKDKIKLKNIFIKKTTYLKENAVAFLYKISSTDSNYENNPERLKYVLVDLSESKILKGELSEEFHNLQLKKSSFSLDLKNINKAHTAAFEYLQNEIEFKFSENETANKLRYEERINELKNRHESLIKDCRYEERKIEERIKKLKNDIASARSYDRQKKCEEDFNSAEKRLKKIQIENEIKKQNSFNLTSLRIQEEKEKYVFDINIYLLSAVIFQYTSQELELISTINKDESAKASYNELTKHFNYVCPICKKNTSEPIISYGGYFCCVNCSSYNSNLKCHFCEKDNVARCIITNNLVLKTNENLCVVEKKYYDPSLMRKDCLGKNVCELYIKKTPSGLIINNNDAIFVKRKNAYYAPSELEKCQYSGELYPKDELIKTTGSDKRIISCFEKTCKETKLTFMLSEMNDDKSILADSLQLIDIENIKYPELKDHMKRNKVQFSENTIWVYISQKTLLSNKRLLFHKKTKKIIIL